MELLEDVNVAVPRNPSDSHVVTALDVLQCCQLVDWSAQGVTFSKTSLERFLIFVKTKNVTERKRKDEGNLEATF